MILYKDPFGITPIIEPVIMAMGYELWGLECQTGTRVARVRIYIDCNTGVTLEDCSRVSQRLSAVLGAQDPITMPYTLEISSPGINRPLFTIEQMQGAVGNKIKIRTLWPIEERRNIGGILAAVKDEKIIIKTDSEDTFAVPVNAIRNAKLDIEIKFND